MSVKINNVSLKLVTGRAGKQVTEVSSPEALAGLYTTAQLNRIAENYLGKTFNKVARKKMAEKIFPVLAEKAGATTVSSKKKEPGERKSRLYTVVDCTIPADEKVTPQCRKIGEVCTSLASDGGKAEVTKEQILDALQKSGFATKGNPWNNVMYYRAKLVELGVMER